MTKTKKPKLFRKVLSSIMAMAVMTSNFAGTASVFADELSSDNNNSDVMIINNDGTGVEILGATDDMPFEISSSTDDLNITTTATEALTSSATETETELSETEAAFSTEFTDVETEIAQSSEETDAEQVDSTSTEPVDYENLTEQEQIELLENEAPPVEVEKDNSVVDMADYILANINPEYAKADKLDELDILLVKQTMAIGSMLPDDGKNLDTLWFGADGAYQSAFVNQAMDHVFLYNTDDNSDYYVAYANTAFKDESMTLAEVTFAYNNLDGEVVEDCIYDENTGLVYVPKKYTEENKNECGFGNIQVQFFQLVDDYSPEASFEVVVDGDNVDGDVSDSGIATANANDMITSIQLAEDKDAVKDIKAEDVNVIVNGVDTDEFIYDEENGVVLLNQSPVTVSTVEIDIDSPTDTERAMTWVLDNVFGGMSADAEASNGSDWTYFMAGGSVEFDNNKRPMVSDYFEITSSAYTYNVGSLGNTYAPTPTTENGLAAMVNAVLANSTGDLKNYANTMFASYFASYVIPSGTTVKGDKSGYQYVFPKTGTLSLACAHIDRASNLSPSIGSSVDLGSDSMLACRVLGVYDANGNAVDANDYEGYMTIGVASDTIYTQTMVGAFKIAWKTTPPPPPPPKCAVSLDKDFSSTDKSYVEANPDSFSLENALFELTNTDTGVSWRGYTNSEGKYKFTDLPAGNYKLVEKAPSLGCMITGPWKFKLEENVHTESNPYVVGDPDVSGSDVIYEPIDKSGHISLTKHISTASLGDDVESYIIKMSNEYNVENVRFDVYASLNSSTFPPTPSFSPYAENGINVSGSMGIEYTKINKGALADGVELGKAYIYSETASGVSNLSVDTSKKVSSDTVYITVEKDSSVGTWFRFVETSSSNGYSKAAPPYNVFDVHCNEDGSNIGQFKWRVASYNYADKSETADIEMAIDYYLTYDLTANPFYEALNKAGVFSFSEWYTAFISSSSDPRSELLEMLYETHDYAVLDEYLYYVYYHCGFKNHVAGANSYKGMEGMTDYENNIGMATNKTALKLFYDYLCHDSYGRNVGSVTNPYQIGYVFSMETTFDNEPLYGDFEITKADIESAGKLGDEEYYSLKDATFDLYSKNYDDLAFSDLKSGTTYIFNEKSDSFDLVPLTDTLLDAFKSDDDQSNDDYKYHDENVLYVYNLPLGDYELVETSGSLGHNVYPEPVSIHIRSSDTNGDGEYDVSTSYDNLYYLSKDGVIDKSISVSLLHEPYETGTISLVKKSSDENITCKGQNANYDLAGAEYGLYDVDPALNPTVKPIKVEKTVYNSDIDMYMAVFDDLFFGKYWVKEVKAPKGYELSDTIFESEITQASPIDKLEHADGSFFIKEQPVFDPIDALLVKTDSNSKSVDGESINGTPSGGASLEGAEFAVYHFDNYDMNAIRTEVGNLAKAGTAGTDLGSAVFTGKFKTVTDPEDKLVKLKLNNDTLVNNSYKHKNGVALNEFLKQANNEFAFPLGTIAVVETKAPNGYEISEDIYMIAIREKDDAVLGKRAVRYIVNPEDNSETEYKSHTYSHVKADGSVVTSESDAIINAPNTPVYGSIEAGKYDDITFKPQGDADLWADFIVYNKTNNSSNLLKVNVHEIPHVKFIDPSAVANFDFKADNNDPAKEINVVIANGPVKNGDPIIKMRAGYSKELDDFYTAIATEVLPIGDYHIAEVACSGDYSDTAVDRDFSITVDNYNDPPEKVNFVDADGFTNTAKHAGVRVSKVDETTKEPTPQGSAKFENAEFTIYNISDKMIVTPVTPTMGQITADTIKNDAQFSTLRAAGDKKAIANYLRTNASLPSIVTIGTNAEGIATSELILPVGKYCIIETDAPHYTDANGIKVYTGYDIDEDYYVEFNVTTEDVAKINDVDKLVVVDPAEEPLFYGGIEVGKYDAETKMTPQGDADLWADFVVYLNSENVSVELKKVDGVTYVPSSEIMDYKFKDGERVVLAEGKITNTDGVKQPVAKLRAGYDRATDKWYTTSTGEVLPYATYSVSEEAWSPDYTPYNNIKHVNECSMSPDNRIKSFFDKNNNGTVDAAIGEFGLQENSVLRGGISVQKEDIATGKTTPQGDADFAGAEFTIYNESAKPIVYKGDTIGVNEVVTKIYTDSKGYAALSADSLPVGTYRIKETCAPCLRDADNNPILDANGNIQYTGYSISSPAYNETFKITSANTGTVNALPNVDEPVFTYTVEIDKIDKDLGISMPLGDADLWAEYDIINVSKDSIVYGGLEYATNAVVVDNIRASAATGYKCIIPDLPYGTYLVKEVAWSKDYKPADDMSTNGVMITLHNPDTAIVEVVENVNESVKGKVSVQKFDFDSRSIESQGDATLEGAVFEIICNTDNPDGVKFDKDTTLHKGDVVCEIKTDATAFASTPDSYLPIGKYIIREASAPVGYINHNWEREFEITGENYNKDFTDAPEEGLDFSDFTPEYIAAHPNDGVPEKVITGSFKIAKFDWDKRMAEPQGDAELWATFKLTNESAKSVTINGVEYPKGATIANDLKAECKYDAETKTWDIVYAGMSRLPYGTYKISETGTCDDYTIFGCDRLFSIRENGQTFVFDKAEGDENLAASNSVKRGSITVNKFTEGLRPGAIGDATLYNAEFTIWNLSRESIMIGDAKDKEIGTTEYNVEDFKNGKFGVLTDANKVGSIYTGPDGVARMGNLPIGTYIIRETNPPEGYEPNKTWFKIVSITADDLNPDLSEKVKETVIDPYNTYACPDKVIAGSVRIEKFDKEFGKPEALYDKALEGIRFEIINRSVEEVTVGDEVFKVGDVISNVEMITRWDDTLKTYVAEAKLSSNSTAVIEGNELLPYGTYEIREIGKENNGKYMATSLYLASDETYTFSIRQKNEVVSVDNSGNDMTFHDTPVRADVKFIKLGEDSKENINRLDTAWLIVDQNGEKHIIRTNKDGEYDSHYSKHDGSRTAACNVNDGLLDRLTINEKNEVVVDGNAAAELILKETENQKPEVVDTQLWFGTGEFGTKAPINDTLGALPYGTYTFYEIPSDTNHGYSLISFDVVVDAAGVTTGKTIVDEVEVEYDVIDMGEVVDTMIEIKTVAQDPETKEHFGYADTEITIVDTVECINLEVGTEYTLKGILMNQDTNERVLDADGNEVTSEIKFVAEEKNCFKEVTFTFNAPADFAGTSVVVFEDLYDGEKRMATHANITDENQTINYPKVWTNAIADATNDHDAPAKAGTIIRDTVSYENLTVGKEYTINGILMDREANDEALDANGKEITSSITFTPTEPNGEVEIVFEFDASNLGGHTLVAYESLEFNGVRIALHADIEDKNQTVHFPKIGTSAMDALTETHQGVISEQTIFVDTVKYENLIAGREYTISGKLMIKDTDTVLKHADGSEVTSSVTFTAQDTSGEVQMQFVFDSTLTQNKDIVAFEYLDRGGIELAVHADINDKEQTNEYPQVGTSALYGDTKMQEGLAKKDTVIKDTVEYKNLIVGEKYEVQGVLMNKDTETPALDANGKEITASATFTAAKTNGTVVVEFKFDASNFAGETFVVFEELYYKSVLIAVHKEFDDKKQTINFPKIETTLLDSETNDHEANADEEITLIDTVTYENLTVGEEYTMSGTLMNKKTGKAMLDDNGKQITATKTFKAEKADGVVEIEFKFKGVTLKGETVVAFETLTRDNIEVAVHTDINDEEQTVRFPEIRTLALNPEINAHQGVHSENAVIIDTIKYENVTPNKSYKLKGILMNPATGETITDENGNPITAETSFVPTTENGTTEVEFRFNSLAKSYYDIVVFEYLFSNDITVATHTDINDKDQLMEFAHIGTQALYGDTQMQEGLAKIDAVINDTVKYENLIVGKDYRLIGTLMNQATGSPVLDKDGKEITSQVDFKPETTDGEIVVPFKFDATDYAGETFVVFEKLYFKALTEDAPYVEITKHEDITDKGQTINFPDIETTLLDTITNTHEAFATETIKLVDTVSYENLTVGKTYVMNGVLMDKETGNKMLDDNGNEITGSTEFTPTEPDGEVEVVFEFSGISLAGKSVVAFEDCTRDGITVAIHTDIEDEEQTVDFPKIGTKAVDSLTNDHHGVRSENAVIIDTVEYENLNPNEEYVLKGVLMNKDTNEPITHEDGTPVTAETTFTPSETDGVAEVVFEFNSLTIPCFNLVVFEDLYHNDFEVATHSDIEDEEQSVGYSEIKTKAVYGDTGRQEGLAADEVVIYDTVTYKNFKVGDDYIITGKLVSKETGEDAIDANGNAITGETVFTPETPDGEVIVEFKFNASEFGGQTFVVFEKAYRTFGEGEDITRVEMTSHEDINDDKQTINFPKIETELLDGNAGTHEIIANETVELVDTVTYENLTVGEEYVMNGVLMNKETGEPMLDAEGNEIKSQTVFTPEEPNGVVEVIFTFNGVNLAGETVVAFEDCKHGDITVAVHTDIEDEDQTVKFPKIQTLLHKYGSDDKSVYRHDKIVLVDEVMYENLTIGNSYTVRGVLMDKDTKEAVKDVDGNPITAETSFVAVTEDGTTSITFEFDGTVTDALTVVAFDELYAYGAAETEDDAIADSTEPSEDATEDATEESTESTEENTEATDATEATEESTEETQDATEVTDTMTRQLADNGIAIMADEETTEATEESAQTETTEAIAESTDATGDITSETEASSEESTESTDENADNGVLVAAGKDFEDENETMTVIPPEMGTVALDKNTEDHRVMKSEQAVLVDTVNYENLNPGTEYTVKGVLMDKETGEALLDKDGKTINAETIFTPEQPNGSVEVTFTFDSTLLMGKTIVVFEDLYIGERLVLTHADIEDTEQTVYVLSVDTKATGEDDRSKTIPVGKKVIIEDRITFKNFVIGEEYWVEGQLMNKKTGEPVGKPVIAWFVPDKTSGVVTIVFELDTTGLMDETLVCFETVTDKEGNLLAEHKDINDEDQSVKVEVKTEVQTGIQQYSRLAAQIAMAAMLTVIATLAFIVLYKKRKMTQLKKSNK